MAIIQFTEYPLTAFERKAHQMATGDGHTQSEQKWELVQCASTGQSSSFGGLVNNKVVYLNLTLKLFENHGKYGILIKVKQSKNRATTVM